MSWLSHWVRNTFYASKKPKTKVKRMTSSELRQLLRSLPGTPTIDIPDRDYACPSKEWVLGGFYNWYCKVLDGLKLSYRKNFDCDNFAGMFFELAQACHGQTKDAPTEGLAVGKIKFLVDGDPTRGHAINIVVSEDGAWFIEPQSGSEVTLSSVELRSVYAISFY